MTIAEATLSELREWYATDRLSLEAFEVCAANTIRAQSQGWGWEPVRRKPHVAVMPSAAFMFAIRV